MATFGYTSIGGTNVNGNQNSSYAIKYTLSESADVSKLTIYNDTAGNWKAGIWSEGSSYPASRLGGSSGSVGGAAGWHDYTLTSVLSITAGTYWLGWTQDGNTGRRIYYYDSGGTNQRYVVADNYTTPAPTYPGGGTGVARKVSIYATYTLAGSLPTVTTQAVSAITQTTATGNGNVTDDGGETITERGVCWSTSTNPTTSDSKATSAGTTGSFTASITGLTANTTYYVRAYAINSEGTSYGSQVSFTTLGPKIETLVERFNGSSLNGSLWTNPSGGAVVADGELVLTVLAANSPGYEWVDSAEDYDLTDSSIYFEVLEVGNTASANAASFYQVMNTSNFYVLGWSVQTSGTLYAYYDSGSATVVSSTAFNATTHKYLRIRESSGTTYWDTSEDGKNWTNLTSLSNPFALTDVAVQIASEHFDADENDTTVRVGGINTVTFEGEALYGLEVNSTKVPGTHTNFPGYIDLSEMPPSFWNVVANGGGNIRLYSDEAKTTELAREVVSCDTSTETGEIYVKIPSLSSSTTIYMSVDGESTEPASDSTYGSEAVWADYEAVWHLEEPSGHFLDSTGNGYDSTSEPNMARAAGMLGQSASFNGSNSVIEFGDVLDLGTNDMTITVLMKTSASATGYFVSKAKGAAQDFRYGASMHNSSGYKGRIFFQGDGGSDAMIYGNTDINDSNWHLVHFTFDRDGDGTVYTDASAGTGASISSWAGKNFQSDNPFRIGAYSTADNVGLTSVYNGLLDEVRLRHSVLSANWITTENNNISNVALFWGITEIDSGGELEVSVYDDIESTESVSRLKVAHVDIFAAVSTAEDVSTLRTAALSLIDSIAITESTAEDVARSALRTDNVAITEVVTRSVSRFRAVQEALVITELVSPLRDPAVVLVDTLTISESSTRERSTQVALFDPVAIGESRTTAIAFEVSLFDAISLSEGLIAASGTFGLAVDTLAIGEATTRSVSTSAASLDNLSLTEEVTLSIAGFASLADTINYSDWAEAEQVLVGEAGEALVITESLEVKRDVYISIVEEVSLSELLVAGSEGNYFLAVFSTLEVQEVVLTSLDLRATVFNVVSSSSEVEATTAIGSSVAAGVAIGESVTRTRETGIGVVSGVFISEDLTLSLELNTFLEIYDYLVVADEVDRLVESWASVMSEVLLEEAVGTTMFYSPPVLFDTIATEEAIDTERFHFNQDWWSGRGRINPQNKWSGTARTV